MEERPLFILVPLVYEAAFVAHALGLTLEKTQQSALGSFCTFADVRLHVIGPGAQALPDIDDNACAIVLAGLAGALDPSLQIGNVLIDAEPKIFSNHPIFGSARAARFVHQTRITATAREKAELFRRTGAAAVDMESEPVRQLAARMGLPLIILRAISDTADESLDPLIGTFVTPQGRTSLPRILLTLLRHPGLVFRLTSLQRSSVTAMASLAEALTILLREGLPQTVDQ